MQNTLSNRDITNVLKGFAIISVLANHYIIFYFSNSYAQYANGIIGIFFVLSGYGIYHSLSKYKSINKKSILDYIIKRCVRIYPLFWLSLLLKGNFAFKYYLAIPITHKPDFFITHLIQCYIIAPFLYLILIKYNFKIYLKTIILFMLFIYILFPLTSIPFDRKYFVYRYFFMGHIFLFSLGMVISYFNINFLKNKKLIIISILFLFFVYSTRYENILFYKSAIIMSPLYILITVLFCYCFINNMPMIPAQRLLILFGSYSYSLYLFHMVYFRMLYRIGLIKYGELISIIYIILLFPLFFGVCILLEKVNSNFALSVIKKNKSIPHQEDSAAF